MAIGNRVYLKRKETNYELCEKLARLPASNVADQMSRSCAMNPRIRLMSNPAREGICGPALTVKARAGDNLMLHKALNMAKEGDVIVVSNEEDDTRALMGELMVTYAFHVKKIAALIVDGPIRDIASIGKMDAFVYATGTTPGGPYKEGPGEVNVPVSCGGVSVNPGDYILADADGVIVIPWKDAEKAYELGLAVHAAEEVKLAKTMDKTIDRSWVERTLAQKQVEMIDSEWSE